MDLSKITLPIYDLLGLLVPGLTLLALIAFTALGWTDFLSAVKFLNGPMITAVLLTGFTLGHLVQQFSDWAIRQFTDERFFKRSRDAVWKGPDGDLLRNAVKADGGSIASPDTAFDFCLSKVKTTFDKRDMFLATADFSRAMAAIALLGITAVARTAYDHQGNFWSAVAWVTAGLLGLTITAILFWQRTMRFRDHSETPVFYAYLAQHSAKPEAIQNHAKPENKQ